MIFSRLHCMGNCLWTSQSTENFLGEIPGERHTTEILVPDHHNKANMAIKYSTWHFGFPVHVKVIFTLHYTKYIIALCLKTVHILILKYFIAKKCLQWVAIFLLVEGFALMLMAADWSEMAVAEVCSVSGNFLRQQWNFPHRLSLPFMIYFSVACSDILKFIYLF